MQSSLDEVLTIGERSRYLVDGLPMKDLDCFIVVVAIATEVTGKAPPAPAHPDSVAAPGRRGWTTPSLVRWCRALPLAQGVPPLLVEPASLDGSRKTGGHPGSLIGQGPAKELDEPLKCGLAVRSLGAVAL